MEVAPDEKEINLSNSQIESIREIQGLDKLVNLMGIDLRGSQTTRIEGFARLGHLKLIDLKGNQIPNIEGLGSIEDSNALALVNYCLKNRFG